MQARKPEIPQELVCPLTQQIYLDPVRLPNGAVVEREYIEKWINEKGTNPFTREPLTKVQLVADEVKKAEVDAFLQKHEGQKYYQELKAEQYELQNFAPVQPAGPRGPVDPTEDDMVAIRAAQGLRRWVGHRNRMQRAPIIAPPQRGELEVMLQDHEVAERLDRLLQYPPARRDAQGRVRRYRFDSRPRIHRAPPHPLSIIQQAVESLSDYGVTARLIRRNYQGYANRTIRFNELYALQYLVTGNVEYISGLFHMSQSRNLLIGLGEQQRLTPELALAEISNLRDITAPVVLAATYAYGMRACHLREYDGELGDHRVRVLISLLRDHQIEPQEALDLVRNVTHQNADQVIREVAQRREGRQAVGVQGLFVDSVADQGQQEFVSQPNGEFYDSLYESSDDDEPASRNSLGM